MVVQEDPTTTTPNFRQPSSDLSRTQAHAEDTDAHSANKMKHTLGREYQF